MKLVFSIAVFILMQTNVFAQIIGNEAYKDRYRNSSNYSSAYGTLKPVIIKDSIMIVSAKILFNAKADSLIVTLGLNEEAKTVKDANALINKRLNAFKNDLKAIGITDNDTYVDFITQTKIYDYSLTGNTAKQFIKGFEIKKNVIIKMPASSVFDKVIDAASEHEIYDIVKVDYMNSNMQKFYAEMMAAASALIRQKKDRYLALSPVELLPVAKIATENFFAVYPGAQYAEYQAFETSDIAAEEYSKVSLLKKIERKGKTFYYDKIDQSSFDVVINNASPVVGIQYVLEIQMQYELKRN